MCNLEQKLDLTAPEEAQKLYQLALNAYQTNADKAQCIELISRALESNPNYLDAHKLLSDITMSEFHYLDYLMHIHNVIKPKTYLEIGVDNGRSFLLSSPESYCVGVDPAPKLTEAISDTQKIVSKTSDDFFKKSSQTIKDEFFSGNCVEFAFLDGMHQFEFTLRDFLNTEKICCSDSTIVLHDCYPLNELTAKRDRETSFWSGDVWKVVPALKKYRPDLDIKTLPLRPTGLCVIENLNPNFTMSQSINSIIDEFTPFSYQMLQDNKDEILNFHSNAELNYLAKT